MAKATASINNILAITDGPSTRLFLNGTEIKNVYSLSTSLGLDRKSVTVEIAFDKAESLRKKDGVSVEDMAREYFNPPHIPAPDSGRCPACGMHMFQFLEGRPSVCTNAICSRNNEPLIATFKDGPNCTLEMLRKHGWSDDAMVQHGHAARKGSWKFVDTAAPYDSTAEDLLRNTLTMINQECEGLAWRNNSLAMNIRGHIDSALTAISKYKRGFASGGYVTTPERYQYYCKWSGLNNTSQTLHAPSLHALSRDEAQLLVACGHRTFAWYDKNFPVSK